MVEIKYDQSLVKGINYIRVLFFCYEQMVYIIVWATLLLIQKCLNNPKYEMYLGDKDVGWLFLIVESQIKDRKFPVLGYNRT